MRCIKPMARLHKQLDTTCFQHVVLDHDRDATACMYVTLCTAIHSSTVCRLCTQKGNMPVRRSWLHTDQLETSATSTTCTPKEVSECIHSTTSYQRITDGENVKRVPVTARPTRVQPMHSPVRHHALHRQPLATAEALALCAHAFLIAGLPRAVKAEC